MTKRKAKKPMEVVLDPRMLKEVKDDPELLAALMEAKAMFEMAAKNAGPGASEEDFNREMKKLGGELTKLTPEEFDELPSETKNEIIERTRNPITRQ